MAEMLSSGSILKQVNPPQVDWNEIDPRSRSYIKNKPLIGDGNGGGSLNGFTIEGNPSTQEKINLILMINELFQTISNINVDSLNGFTVDGTPSTAEKINIILMINELYQSISNIGPIEIPDQLNGFTLTGTPITGEKVDIIKMINEISTTLSNINIDDLNGFIAEGMPSTLEKNNLILMINELYQAISNIEVSGLNGFTADGIPSTNEKTNLILMINEIVSSINDIINIDQLNGFTVNGIPATSEQVDIITMINEIVQSVNDLGSPTQINGFSAEGVPLTSDKSNLIGMINELFQSVSSGKANIATALTDVGVPSTGSDTFTRMASKIRTLSTLISYVKTKLNITAPSTNTVTLTYPISINALCVTVLKYIPGDTVIQYICDFNNGDSINFIYEDGVIFDGTMKLNNKILKEKISLIPSSIGSNIEYISSSLIDKTLYKSVDTINTSINSNSIDINVIGTIDPRLVLAKGDIDISNIEKVDSIEWNPIESGNSRALLILSVDSGITWKAFKDDEWIDVDISSFVDIEDKGMNKSIVNALTIEDIMSIVDGEETIRFGYYLNMDNGNDILANDSITLKVTMLGSNRLATSSEYSMQLNESGTEIVFIFSTSGTYTINWLDNNSGVI